MLISRLASRSNTHIIRRTTNHSIVYPALSANRFVFMAPQGQLWSANAQVRNFSKMVKEDSSMVTAQRDTLERDLKDKIAIDKLSGNINKFGRSLNFHSDAYETSLATQTSAEKRNLLENTRYNLREQAARSSFFK